MITFNVNDLPGLYALLASHKKDKDTLASLLSEENEKLKKIVTLLEGRSLTERHFSTGQIPLIGSLEYVSPTLSSDGVYYRGDTTISCVGIDCRDIWNRLRDSLNESNVIYGNKSIMFMADRTPLFIIEKSCAFLHLKFGDSGTPKRKLNGYEQFETDIRNFTECLTKIVNVCIDQSPDINYELNFRRDNYLNF